MARGGSKQRVYWGKFPSSYIVKKCPEVTMCPLRQIVMILKVLSQMEVNQDLNWRMKISPWEPLIEEAKRRNASEYEKIEQNFIGEWFDEEITYSHAYTLMLPKSHKDLESIYLQRMRRLRRNCVHKNVMNDDLLMVLIMTRLWKLPWTR